MTDKPQRKVEDGAGLIADGIAELLEQADTRFAIRLIEAVIKELTRILYHLHQRAKKEQEEEK